MTFDPLDGSSIFKSNFAVGTILGIWNGGSPIGQKGRDLASAAYAIYGPKTLLVIARPISGNPFWKQDLTSFLFRDRSQVQGPRICFL